MVGERAKPAGPSPRPSPRGRGGEGFAQLGKRKMTFEGWCYMKQIGELADLARSYPDTTIILNHFGGPLGQGSYAGKQKEVLDVFHEKMERTVANQAKQLNLLLVLERGRGGPTVYSDNTLDISNRVIDELNKE